MALKSALARDARKDMLLLIERAIDSEAQGALTWDAWYEQALVEVSKMIGSESVRGFVARLNAIA